MYTAPETTNTNQTYVRRDSPFPHYLKKKSSPISNDDADLLNLEMIYQWYFSEDTILSPVETQMCNAAALICSNAPVQAMWHTRGIMRHSGSKEQAKFAQQLGLAVAGLYGCKTGEITKVEDIDVDSKSAG